MKESPLAEGKYWLLFVNKSNALTPTKEVRKRERLYEHLRKILQCYYPSMNSEVCSELYNTMNTIEIENLEVGEQACPRENHSCLSIRVEQQRE